MASAAVPLVAHAVCDAESLLDFPEVWSREAAAQASSRPSIRPSVWLVTGLLAIALYLSLGERRSLPSRAPGAGYLGLRETPPKLKWRDANDRCLSAALDVEGGGPGPGTAVLLAHCDGEDPKQDFLEDGGMLRWMDHPQLCITAGVTSHARPSSLLLYECVLHNPRQQWVRRGGSIQPAGNSARCVADSAAELSRALLRPCAGAGHAVSDDGKSRAEGASDRPQVPTVASTSELTAAAPSPASTEAPLPAVTGASCSKPEENCRHTGQCCQQGTQCYLRDEDFGACHADCDTNSSWSCRAVGERTPMATPGAWPGEECIHVKKCNNKDYECYRKNTTYAVCRKNPPEGFEPVPIGGSQGEYTVLPASGDAVAGTTLYCFMGVLPGSHEESLRVEAEKRDASIFACDAHAVYPSFPARTVRKAFANTDSFIKVWAEVFKAGVYKDYDWTIKVDPDSVFLPNRLRKHLEDLRPPDGKPIYIKNTFTDFGFVGALEVMSVVAVMNLADSYRGCRRSMPGVSGEDVFLKDCLDAIGAGSMIDEALLRTPNDLGDCEDWSRVVFHPHKAPDDWARCYEMALQ